jgi:glycerol-3-phosphate acyltransferase PlsY
LTAEVVARYKAGKSACKMGSGNPGMANIGALFGKKWAAVTLLGDVSKTILPCLMCQSVLFPQIGRVAILYAGLGAMLGHGFPIWNKFRGGKGVAVFCTYLFLFSPAAGGTAGLVGLCAVAVTKYLAVGALVIPVSVLFPVIRDWDMESGFVFLAGAAVLFFLHRDSIKRIVHRTEKKTDLIRKWKKI